MYACSASRSGCPANGLLSGAVLSRGPSDRSERGWIMLPGASGARPTAAGAPGPARWSPSARPCQHGPMVSIGLVLGAGGVVGRGVPRRALAALADATGWDPRTADLIVGTSAGANTAASLRGGLSAADHLARATDRPLSPEGAGPARRPPRTGCACPSPRPRPRPPWGYLPQAPWLVAPAFLRPGPGPLGRGPGRAASPTGGLPTAFLGERVRAAAHRTAGPSSRPGSWPTAPATAAGSCSAATTSTCPTWPPRSRPPPPCPAASARCGSPRAATSTARCSRRPTPTWSPASASTWSSSARP